MRALCGAIITAGALIGLGLTALGLGYRYSGVNYTGADGPVTIHLGHIDGPLQFVLVFLTCVTAVGLGITFLGLAYHHHRREREHLLHLKRTGVKT